MTRKADLLAAAAALLGATGVTLAAASSHLDGGEFGRLASEFCLIHASVLVGVAATARTASNCRAKALLLAGVGLGLGTVVFSLDLAELAFMRMRLFPFAAPLGGSLMIVSWLALAAAFALRE